MVALQWCLGAYLYAGVILNISRISTLYITSKSLGDIPDIPDS
jgi:hypothetical protein